MPSFFGKYRGKVAGNRDPLNLGRLQVEAPAVLGDGRLSWAMPCTPYAGPQEGFLALPPVGANVWVEFEGGDLDYPIWSGCFWGNGETPITPALPELKLFKINGITLTLSNLQGQAGFTLEVGPPVAPQPLTLTLDAQGIALTNGAAAVKLTAQGVEVAHGAATVKLSPAGVEVANPPATLKVAPAGIELNTPPAKVNVAAAALELSNGAANIKLTPVGVNINNGALEVI